MRTCCLLAAALVLSVLSASAIAQDAGGGTEALEALARALVLPHEIISGKCRTFSLEITVRAPPGEKGREYRIGLSRCGADEFSVSADDSPLGPMALVRTAEATAIVDERRKRVFFGRGPMPEADALAPGEFARRLVRSCGDAGTFADILLGAADSRALALQLVGLLQLVEKPAEGGKVRLVSKEPVSGRVFTLTIVPEESRLSSIEWTSPAGGGRMLYALNRQAAIEAVPREGYETVEVDRGQLERTLLRGLPRGLEVLYRRDHPRQLRDRVRSRDGGKLIIRQGQRLCLLSGDPRQIGTQHGALLKREIRRAVDSVLYTFCLSESLARGRWVYAEFEKAWAALAPHIGEEYRSEMAAVAEAAGVDLRELQLANAMPALFHCSGFALKGKATVGGKLYHGRVLDYMTGIGLQDEAVLFVVRKAGAKAFAGVGYAGLVGCVTGMNAEGLAVGVMGGGGEGKWDGTAMPILVRTMLERSASLDEAKALLRDAKRTCEYYYTVSDGQAGDAWTAAATPEAVRFFGLGEKVPWLAEPIADCTIVSGGERLKALADQVRQGFGRFDAASARKLMDHPVAAKGGNLHNVLFAPQDLVMWVANARGRNDACQETYYRYDLGALMKETAEAGR